MPKPSSTERVELSRLRIVAVESVRTGHEAVWHLADGIHAGEYLVAVLGLAGALPLGHPVAGEGQPVGSAAHTAGIWNRPGPRRSQSHGIDLRGFVVHIHHFAHDVAGALVGGQVVVEAPEGGLADARFLGAAAPVPDVVPRTQSGKPPRSGRCPPRWCGASWPPPCGRCRRGRCAGSCTTATCRCPARCCPRRSRRCRSATRGGRRRRRASRRRSPRSRTSGAARSPFCRDRSAASRRSSTARFNAVVRSGRLQTPNSRNRMQPVGRAHQLRRLGIGARLFDGPRTGNKNAATA